MIHADCPVHIQLRGELIDCPRVFHRLDNGTERDQRIAFEIHLGNQTLRKGMSEH